MNTLKLKQTLQAGFGFYSRQDLPQLIAFTNIGNRVKWQVILPSCGLGQGEKAGSGSASTFFY